MLKAPALYGVGADYEDDIGLVQKRADIIHSAAVLLEKSQLIKYERASGRFSSTELGRIASYYYVTHHSMIVYNQHLRPTMSTLEIFRVFALSNEFKLLPASVSFFMSWYSAHDFFLRFVKKRNSNWLSCWSVCRFPSRKALKNLQRKSMYYCRPTFRNSNSMALFWWPTWFLYNNLLDGGSCRVSG